MSAVKNESIGPEESIKTISIIQLTRIGDILQTAQAVRLLKLNHPKVRVQLIARKQFAEPIKFIIDQVFDECICLDLKTSINTRDGVNGSITNLLSQIDVVNKSNISVSVNLSFSKTSKYVHSLINSEHKVGPYYTHNHVELTQDNWSQYLFSTVMRGDLNPYNLVDLFGYILGVKVEKTHLNNIEFTEASKNSIILHPFASHDKKRWTESKWTEIIYNLFKTNSVQKIHVVGGNSDKASMDKILSSPILANYKNQIFSMLGKPLEEVYQLADNKTLFIGHDSMVSHLLSFKGVKSLTVSLGTVRPHETAPYSLGNFIIAPKTKCYPCFPTDKCSYFQCHADIPYQTVIAISKQLLSSNSINLNQLKTSVTDLNLNTVNIYKTSTNNIGQLVLQNVLHSDLEIKDLFRDFYNLIWSFTLNQVEPNMKMQNISKDCLQTLSALKKPIENLYELAEFGKKYTRFILEEISNHTPNIKSIKMYSQKIDEIDRLLDILATATPLLAPVVDYAKVSKSNLIGNNIVALTEATFYIYQEISNSSSILYDFTSKFIPTTTTKTSTRKEV